MAYPKVSLLQKYNLSAFEFTDANGSVHYIYKNYLADAEFAIRQWVFTPLSLCTETRPTGEVVHYTYNERGQHRVVDYDF